MSDATRWTLAIVGMLASVIVAMAIMIVLGNRVAGDNVLPNYYDRAANYDQTLAEEEASRATGWQFGVQLQGGTATVMLRDAAGAPVEGAVVELKGFHRARPTAALGGALPAVGPGRYATEVVSPIGMHELVITAVRAKDRFVGQATVEAVP